MTDIPWDKLTVPGVLGLVIGALATALLAVIAAFQREWLVPGKTHRGMKRFYEKQTDRILTLCEQNMELTERNTDLLEELRRSDDEGAP